MSINKTHNILEQVIDGLMRRYGERVPAVSLVISKMVEAGMISAPSDIENDHVAFRTLGVEFLGIRLLERVFLGLGYVRRDAYHFQAKKLDAFWYAPPEPRFPRIFISELRVVDLSERLQEIVLKYTDSIRRDPLQDLDLTDALAIDTFLHTPLWAVPTWQEYQALLTESEYAAWAIYNRYYLNHFTISVHNLPAPYDTIKTFNNFLLGIGVKLNDAGGLIKTSPDGLLLQSSTVAEMIGSEFSAASGTERQRIAGSYVEFAERRPLPQFASLSKSQLERQHRRDGFEAQNADKIFESTFMSQITRGGEN